MASVASISTERNILHMLNPAAVAIVEDYIDRSLRTPRDLWPLVKRYRELSPAAENGDAVACAQSSALYDALVVLVAGRGGK